MKKPLDKALREIKRRIKKGSRSGSLISLELMSDVLTAWTEFRRSFLHLLFHHVCDGPAPDLLAVQRRHESQCFPAQGLPIFRCPYLNLLQGLKTVRDESRAHDGQAFDSAFDENRQFLIGIRLDPGRPAQSRLKGQARVFHRSAQGFLQSIGRGKTLRPIAKAVGTRDGKTAIRTPQTMLAAAIRALHLVFRQTVIAEQDMIGIEIL